MSNLVSQLSRRARPENPDIFLLDNVFQVSKEGQEIGDSQSGIKVLTPYTRAHFNNLFKQMNPSATTLTKMCYYSVDAQGNTAWNKNPSTGNLITQKDFWSAWLKGIQDAINNPSPNTPNYFQKFEFLSTVSFSSGDSLKMIVDPSNPSKFIVNDYQIIEWVRDAIVEAIGYEAFTLLNHGVISFSEVDGEYVLHSRNHQKDADTQDFWDSRLSNFGIGTIVDKRTIPFEGSGLNGYNRPTMFWASDLILGHRQDLKILFIDENGIRTPSYTKTLLTLNNQPLLAELYSDFPQIVYQGRFLRYNREILSNFFSDYYSAYVPVLAPYENSYSGTIDSILEGRQLLLEMLWSMIFEKVSKMDIPSIFPSQTLDKTYAQYVTRDYAMLIFLDLLYRPRAGQRDEVINRDYINLIKNALIQGSGSITLGSTYTQSGQALTGNPIFDATDPVSGKRGLEISIDITRFTPEVLAKILWTLHYDSLMAPYFRSKIRKIENIENKITDPIIHLYQTLYNTLKEYQTKYYAVGSLSQPRTDFSVSFYRPGLGGMNARTTLARQFTDIKKNTITGIDPTNEVEFRKKIASIVFYMVKYSATISMKQGLGNSLIHVLYADLLRILNVEYMKQNFYSTTGTIAGSLQNPNNENAWINSQYFANLPSEYRKEGFSLSTMFPVRLFTDADSFQIWFAKLFNDMATNYEGSNNIYPTIDPKDLLVLE